MQMYTLYIERLIESELTLVVNISEGSQKHFFKYLGKYKSRFYTMCFQSVKKLVYIVY